MTGGDDLDQLRRLLTLMAYDILGDDEADDEAA